MLMDMEVVVTGLDAAVSCLGTYSGMMDLSCDAVVVITSNTGVQVPPDSMILH